MNRRNKPAFTLIELLVVIAIIGVLATVSVVVLQNARAKSRDAKRVADMKQVQTALELFFNDNNRYPTAEEWNTGKIYSTTTGSTSTYMQVIPSAPTPADGDCSDSNNYYYYSATADGSSYTLSFCVGGQTGTFQGGTKCMTSSGFSDSDCIDFDCGDTVAYGGGPYDSNGTTKITGGYYRSVQIGSQCWLADNLNVGTMINSTSDGNQTDNSAIEKYCYNNNAANCTTYGGLYQWNEAMQYSASEGVQGICPRGWHIPTNDEQNTLDQYLTDSPNVCNANRSSAWGCANAGTKLQSGGTSGFNALLAGYCSIDGSFANQGVGAWFWSSSVNNLNAWVRILFLNYSTVYRYHDAQAYGYSVRCVHD